MNDTQIIKAIREGGSARRKAFEYLYHDKSFQKKAKTAVSQPYKLRLSTWEDIFHESLVRLIKQIKKPGKIRLEVEDEEEIEDKDDDRTSSGEKKILLPYFTGICRLVRFEFRRKEIKEAKMPELPYLEIILGLTTKLDSDINQKDLKKILSELVQRLGSRCREVLKLWSLKYSSKEISKITDLNNESTVNVTLSKCKKKLRELLDQNPILRDILKDLR